MARPRPWLFAVASVPYGAFNGLVAVAFPYLLRARGLSVDQIASLSAAVQLPTIWYFLWAPVVDVGMRRRTWIIALSLGSAILVSAAFATTRIKGLEWLLLLASALSQPVSSAVGGLVGDVMPLPLRGRTGGWSQAGILGGGIVAGGIIVALSGHVPLIAEGFIAAGIVGVPALAVLAIDEPRRPPESLRIRVMRVVGETRAMFRRREVWTSFVFFVSPIGAGALMNLFSAVGTDFHASTAMVVTAVSAAGVAAPVGALAGGYLSDRYPVRIVYCAGGLLAALSIALMLALPLAASTYIAGALTYGFATGFAFATFSALAYSLLGTGSAAAATQFTIFMASVNIPVVYMVRIDGLAHARYGVRGMLVVDGAANLAFAALLFVFAARSARRVGSA